jgi:hypothetical protein
MLIAAAGKLTRTPFVARPKFGVLHFRRNRLSSKVTAAVRPAPARRSEDRLQDHPTVRDERHEETQHAAQDDGRDLAVLGVHPDEHEALDRQDRGDHHRERRLPVEGGGDDQPDRADELEDAEGHPGFPRQRTKGRDLLAYAVEHEDLHDARRSVHERGEGLQDPQQDVHRVPPFGFRVGARRAVSPRAIHVLSPDLVTMDTS